VKLLSLERQTIRPKVIPNAFYILNQFGLRLPVDDSKFWGFKEKMTRQNFGGSFVAPGQLQNKNKQTTEGGPSRNLKEAVSVHGKALSLEVGQLIKKHGLSEHKAC
jgi:hypothetical protein